MGPEPVFSGPAETSELIKALNWYNYFYTIRESKEWVEEYLKTLGTPAEEREEILKSDCLNQTIASYCRMASRGAEVDDEIEKMLLRVKESNLSRPRPKRVFTVNQAIADIDDNIDLFLTKGKTVGIDSKKYKVTDVSGAQKHLRQLLEELMMIGVDDQISEAYSHLSKAKVKKYIEFVTNLLNSITADRKPAKKQAKKKVKIKSPLLQVKGVSYLKSDKTFGKLTSFEPKHIIGANEIWIFNVKDRKLSRIIGDKGLAVQGSKVISVKETHSKTVRKPEEFMPQFFKGGKVATRKLFESLSTKNGTHNGRLNGNTLLLRYF